MDQDPLHPCVCLQPLLFCLSKWKWEAITPHEIRHSRKAYQQGSPRGERLGNHIAFHIQTITFFPTLIPTEGAIDSSESPTKTRGKNLKEAKENETGQASEAGASRNELKLVIVKSRWQAAPGIMSCTRQAVEQGKGGRWGQARQMRLGPLTGAQNEVRKHFK